MRMYKEAFLDKRRKWWVHHLWKAEAYAVENGCWLPGIIQNRWVSEGTCFITCTFTGLLADQEGITHILGARLFDTDGDLAVVKNCDIQVLDSEYLLFRFELPIREWSTDYEHAELKALASTRLDDETYKANLNVTTSGDTLNELDADDYLYQRDSYDGSIVSLNMRKRGKFVNKTLLLDIDRNTSYDDLHLNIGTLRIYDMDGTPLNDVSYTYNGTTLNITVTDTNYNAGRISILCELSYSLDVVLSVINGTVVLYKSDLYAPVDTAVITNPETGEEVSCTRVYENGILRLSDLNINSVRIQCQEVYNGN